MVTNNLTIGEGRVAQAVYTWSTKLVNGSKGLGFSTISPALEKSIDWLTRLQPTEFKLFTTNNPSQELYEARERFSEVGRTIRGETSIIYCKTADGTFDVSQRPQPVVHALLADPGTLGLLTASRIPEDFWIRRIEQSSVASLELSDITLDDIVNADGAPASHTCPENHDGAEDFLRTLISQRIQGEGNLSVSSYQDALAHMLLVFPPDVVDEFTHASYVTLDGIQHEIGLRLPRHDLSAITALSPGELAETCPLRGKANAAAKKFLSPADGNFGTYATEVLRAIAPPRKPTPPATTTQQPRTGARHAWNTAAVETGPEPSIALAAARSIRDIDDSRPFSKTDNLALLEKLRQRGAVTQVLEEDTPLLMIVFGELTDREAIWKWSRAWADVNINVFIDLWNKSHIAAFLQVVLFKNLSPAGKLDHRISPDRGIYPPATAKVLQAMRHYPRGGASLGEVIQAGFGNAESTRLFICEAFKQWPDYLYGTVLESADLPNSQMIDYIRFGYDSWAEYRKLSAKEAAALQELLRPKFFDKIKSILGR
jgi:hypothetical protein